MRSVAPPKLALTSCAPPHNLPSRLAADFPLKNDATICRAAGIVHRARRMDGCRRRARHSGQARIRARRLRLVSWTGSARGRAGAGARRHHAAVSRIRENRPRGDRRNAAALERRRERRAVGCDLSMVEEFVAESASRAITWGSLKSVGLPLCRGGPACPPRGRHMGRPLHRRIENGSSVHALDARGSTGS